MRAHGPLFVTLSPGVHTVVIEFDENNHLHEEFQHLHVEEGT